MSEWEKIFLGDLLIRITKGTTPPKGKGFIDSGINYIKSEAISYDGRIYESKFVCIDEETHEKFKRSQLEEDDILFSMAGVFLGKNAIVLKEYLPANTNQALAIIRLNQKLAMPKYISYYLRQPTMIDYINNMSGQSAQPNINFQEISSIEIKLPPLPEQKAIASVLSSLDDKIGLLHRQNQTLEKMAETLFRQWFVEEANTDSISQLIYIQNGYAFKSKDFKEVGSNGVVKIRNISGGIIDIEKTDFIDDSVANSVQERFRITTGDILIAMTGAEIGKLGLIPKTDKNLWLNQRVGLLKEKFPGSKYLAYLQLKSDFGQDYIENTATGSAQPNISGSGIENCGFPKLDEYQIKECSFQIGELYEKIIFNLGQIRTLEKLRDKLLPKLMSGEVRVSEL